MTDTLAIAAEVVTEARGWLLDCGAPAVRSMSNADVLRMVARHYDGGWRAFVAADPDLTFADVDTAVRARYGPVLADWLARPGRRR